MTITPTGKRILVERHKPKEKSSGIILVEPEIVNRGTVLAVGRKCEEISVGDIVVFSPYAGIETAEGNLMMTEEEVFYVIEE